MMNNFTHINKFPYNHHQTNHYRSNERSNHSPNIYNNINNNINNIKSKKISKNNNIRYINQKNNNKQIYLEGDLNNFMDTNNNIQLNNQQKERTIYFNNYIQKIPNERKKNIRGIPKKSPMPIKKGYITKKYLNNSNMSNISKYSNHTHNASYHMADSQLLNNMSQISGHSNYSYKSHFSHGPLLDNERVRPYSFTKNKSSLNKNKRNNEKIIYNNKINNINKNVRRNNNNKNRYNNNNSPYIFSVKNNNYINNIINNNINIIKNLNKTKYRSNFSYNNNINNNSFSNISNMSNITNISFFTQNHQSNNNNIYNQNINIYGNINNELNYIIPIPISRPMTSQNYKSRSYNNTNLRKNKNINYHQEYNSDTDINKKIKMKMMLKNHNKMNNNNYNYYNNGYNKNTYNREHSAFLSSRKNINNNINNNFINNNINNQMINLHIINKGQIINNNYNNINNNLNNNMNNVYIYKYDESHNNIKSKKYGNIKMNLSKRKNNIQKINNMSSMFNNEINSNIYNEMMQLNQKNSKNKNLIRNNSSSGVGITGELNNLINARNNLRNQFINLQKNLNQRKIGLNQSQLSNNSLKKSYIVKKINKIHHFSHVGFNGEKDKENNQDIAFIEKNFANNKTFLYMAVCDGHGIEGHSVSSFIKQTLPKDLSNALINTEILTSDKNKKKKIYNIIGSTFIKVNEKLIGIETINSIFSGTTCVSLIYTPIKLICANIGDSRAVLGRYDKKNKKYISINLSRDHKPTEEDEPKRILKKGGRIKPFIDENGIEIGPPRVWVKDDDVPGLAMTRSFGDRVASIAGTICVPEIKEYYFNEGDKFVVIASDGVWEFISSEECVDIVGKYYENNMVVECCEYLYEESRKRWLEEEDVVDDITMLLIFFD